MNWFIYYLGMLVLLIFSIFIFVLDNGQTALMGIAGGVLLCVVLSELKKEEKVVLQTASKEKRK